MARAVSAPLTETHACKRNVLLVLRVMTFIQVYILSKLHYFARAVPRLTKLKTPTSTITPTHMPLSTLYRAVPAQLITHTRNQRIVRATFGATRCSLVARRDSHSASDITNPCPHASFSTCALTERPPPPTHHPPHFPASASP